MNVNGLFLFSVSLSLILNVSLHGQIKIEKTFNVDNAKEISLKIRSESELCYMVEWGDGAIDTIASNEKFSRSYESPYTGPILLRGVIGANVRAIEINGGFAFNISELYAFAPFLDSLIIGGESACFGNLASKPPSLIYIDVQKGDFYGDFNSDRLRNVIRLRVVEGNQISLDIADFDKRINYIGVTGKNEIYGSLDSFDYPLLTHLDIKGNNVITGDIGKMKNIPPIFVIQGNQAVNSYSAAEIKFTSTPKLFNVTGANSSLDSDEIDQLIIDLDNAAEQWKSSKRIFLDGAHNPPSEFSAVARDNLTNKGVELFVN